jgi:hypothetical protein
MLEGKELRTDSYPHPCFRLEVPVLNQVSTPCMSITLDDTSALAPMEAQMPPPGPSGITTYFTFVTYLTAPQNHLKARRPSYIAGYTCDVPTKLPLALMLASLIWAPDTAPSAWANLSTMAPPIWVDKPPPQTEKPPSGKEEGAGRRETLNILGRDYPHTLDAHFAGQRPLGQSSPAVLSSKVERLTATEAFVMSPVPLPPTTM